MFSLGRLKRESALPIHTLFCHSDVNGRPGNHTANDGADGRPPEFRPQSSHSGQWDNNRRSPASLGQVGIHEQNLRTRISGKTFCGKALQRMPLEAWGDKEEEEWTPISLQCGEEEEAEEEELMVFVVVVLDRGIFVWEC